MSNILIVGPDLKLFGGVAFLLKSLQKNNLFDKDNYFSYGNKGFFGNFKDIYNFLHIIKKYDAVHLNPSFEYKSILRDILYAKIALVYKKNVIISWMGWNENVEEFFLKYKIARSILVNILNDTNINIVSNELFKVKLTKLGYKKEALVIYPPYDNALDKISFSPKKLQKKIKILFLARIENSKGIDKLIQIFNILHKQNKERYEFTIGGDGPELERIKKLSLKMNIPITYTGYIKNEQKINILREQHIFLFPSVHPEGIPLILAEAMYAGMYLVVSNTGGISSVITNQNGLVLDKNDSAEQYAQAIIDINENMFYKKSKFNISFANNEFKPSIISNKYKSIYRELNE